MGDKVIPCASHPLTERYGQTCAKHTEGGLPWGWLAPTRNHFQMKNRAVRHGFIRRMHR